MKLCKKLPINRFSVLEQSAGSWPGARQRWSAEPWPWMGRIELQVKGRCLGRLLFLGAQSGQAVGEGVGDAEFHFHALGSQSGQLWLLNYQHPNYPVSHISEQSICTEIFQNFYGQWFLDFRMSRDSFHNASARVDPQRVRTAFPFQIATGHAQSSLQISAFHPTMTFS